VLAAVNRCAVTVGAIAALSIVTVLAQERPRRSQSIADSERYYALSTRAAKIAPRRRDAPMRDMNITDEEVREIQGAALDVVPRAIINIGAVTTGCPCEDGGSCTDQVWIVATDPSRTKGLQLSRILGRWVVGPVQQWWLRYDDLQKRRGEFKDFGNFRAAQQKILDDLPLCTEAEARAAQATSAAGIKR
jgi:hypothetical protein